MASEPHFQQLASILRRRSRLIFVVAAFGTMLAGIGGLLIPPRYTAKAQIVVEPQPADLLGGQAVVVAQPADESAVLVGGQAAVVAQPTDESAVQTQVIALTSHDHLQRVLNSLSDDPNFRPKVPETRTEPRATVDDLWRRVGARLRDSWLTATGIAKDTPLRRTRTDDAADPMKTEVGALNFEELERRLNVYQERASHVIAVSFTSTSPEAAAAVANRIAQLYVERQAEQKRAYAGRALAWLDERIPELRNEVQRAEEAVQQYRIAHGLADAKRTDVIDQQIADLNRQLTTAKSELAGRQARLAYVRDLQRRGSDSDALIDNLNSPVLAELHRQELALLQSEAELATMYLDKHPKMQLVRNQLQEVRQKITQEVDRAVMNLENEAQIAGAQMRSIQQRFGTVQGASSGAQGAEVRLHELEREAAASRQHYVSVLQRQIEVRERQGTMPPDVLILSLASPPDRPSSPNPLLFLLPALIVSSICGSLLAVVVERLDRGLRSEREINDALGIPCIGLVPQLRRVGRTRPHQYLLAKPFAAYTEGIRSVVAALQLAAPSRVPKLILISSSVPGEGKTTLAVSFAAYLALLGRHVLLVDLDFRHPAILRELGGKAETGVVDLLLHDRPSAEVIQRVPGLPLDYLPAHRRPGDPLSPFAGERMPRLLRELRESYDCVVIDSPPLLAISEARLLASMVDKVIFAVKWGSTRRDVAQNALNLLRNAGFAERDYIDLASAVMTQVNMKKYARYRYGDTGEILVKYKKYYDERPNDTHRRSPQLAGWSGRQPTGQVEIAENAMVTEIRAKLLCYWKEGLSPERALYRVRNAFPNATIGEFQAATEALAEMQARDAAERDNGETQKRDIRASLKLAGRR